MIDNGVFMCVCYVFVHFCGVCGYVLYLCVCVQLEVARKCGADVVLNPSQCDVEKEVKALNRGRGCDVYIEATGHPASVRQG